jgi:hypothetical protein
MNFLKLTIIGIFIANHVKTVAQSFTSEPVFGTVLERKAPKDYTKKRLSFNPSNPAFLLIGAVGSVLIGFENGSTNKTDATRGEIIEYKFFNRW